MKSLSISIFNSGLVDAFITAVAMIAYCATNSPILEGILTWVTIINFFMFVILLFTNLIAIWNIDYLMSHFNPEPLPHAWNLMQAARFIKVLIVIGAFYIGFIWFGWSLLLKEAMGVLLERELAKHNINYEDLS